MKIYPCDHEVKIKKQIDLGDIPLSYLQEDETDKNISIRIFNDFIKPYSKKNIQPYQIFNTRDMLFFDEKMQKVDPLPYLEERGTQYYAKPMQIISESAIHPSEKFTYSVLLEKQDKYKKSTSYNILITAASHETAEALSKICCHNDKQKIYPSNIIFNNGTQLTEDFINQDPVAADFLFISLSDLRSSATALQLTVASYIERLLKQNHTNLWILDDNFSYSYTAAESEDEAKYEVNSPYIFASVTGNTDKDDDDLYYRFYTNKKWSEMPNDTYEEYFKTGGPLQIIKRAEGGYAILSHPDIILNSGRHKKLIIEVLVYVYLNTYYNTQTYSSFVTDDPIDYFININKKYGLCHPKINLSRILSDERFNTDIRYQIIKVNTSANASYTGVTRFNDLLFKKVSNRLKDRSKGNNMLVYTNNKTLLICPRNNTVLQTIESGVIIHDNEDMTITVDPIFSTKYKMALYTTQTLSIPIKVGIHYLVYSKDNGGMLLIEEPGQSLNGIKLAEIRVQDKRDIVYKDVRVPGGGEWSEIPNYEMIDTGNINGRPLRYGSLLIIQLPMRFKTIKNEIQSEVEKHMTSGDYPILVFKD